MDEFRKVGSTTDIPPGKMITVPGIDRVDVCVLNLDGKYFAVSNICTHKGAPLNRGSLKGKYLVCPWHKANFRVEDGRAFWPAERALRRFEIKVEGDNVYVKVPPKKENAVLK
jgi:nitrite reductase/ring-hydroxylating ferredoxin subunit